MDSRHVFCLLTAAALLACNHADEGPAAPAGEKPAAGTQSGEAVKIYEEALGETSRFTVYEDKAGHSVLLEFHADRDKDIQPLLEKAIAESTLAGTYRALAEVNPRLGALPAVLAELDAKSPVAGGEDARARGAIDSESPAPAVGPETGPVKALAKTAAVEPEWDWYADALWFKDWARSLGQLQYEWFSTNREMAWVQRNAFKHTGVGLAASHIASARFRSWREDCGLFDCDWVKVLDKTLAPRNGWYYRTNDNSGNAHTMRKYQMDGMYPSKKVHLGLLYATTKNYTSNLPNLKATIPSYSKGTVQYTVANTGNVTANNILVRLSYSPTVPAQSETFTISSLAPGASYTRSKYTPSPISTVEIFADPNNAIRESNELDNLTSRINSNL